MNLRSVAAGAAVAIVVGVPVATIGSVVLDDGSDLVFLFALLTLVGFAAAGWFAGRREPQAPLAHGAAAAFAGFVVAQAVAALLQVVRDDDIEPVAILFNALLAAAVGLFGGWLASRRAAPVRPI